MKKRYITYIKVSIFSRFEEMGQFIKKVSQIREHVNHPWKLQLIFSDRVKWDKVCASMDVLEDTQLAIDSYFALNEFTAYNGGYLFLYGLLQAFFMQQDAASHLSEGLFSSKIKWDVDYPELYAVRELRNDAIGHPTKRGNDDSFHYISTVGLKKDGFSIASYYPKKQHSTQRDIDLIELRVKHEMSICTLLDKVIQQMNQDLTNHKEKFKDMKLSDLVPNNHGYVIGKVYEGIHSDYSLAKMNFFHLKENFEGIVSEIDKRYTSYTALYGVEDSVNKMRYILSRLEDWVNSNQLYNNKDAEVFLDCFNDRYKEFKVMLEEIDESFLPGLSLTDNDIELLSKDVAGKETLKAACVKLRTAIERTESENLPTGFEMFPYACGDTSLVLAKYLKNNGFGTFKYVSGWNNQKSHAWLEQNGLIIDITASQFDDRLPDIVLTTSRTLHDQFGISEKRSADYNKQSPESKAVIAQVLKAIEPIDN